MKEKGRFLKKYRSNQCINCSVPLDILDKYCHNCGQINTTKKLAFSDFFSEFFSSIFSYDSRLRHTLGKLLFSPGKISKDYIEGKRIKYANPFRFYLSIAFIFFIVNGLLIDFDSFTTDVKNSMQFTKGERSKAIDSIKHNLQKEFKIKIDSSKHPTINTSFLNNNKTYKKTVVYYTQEQLDSMNIISKGVKLWKMYKDYYNRTKETSIHTALADVKHTPNWLNKYIYLRVLKTVDLGNNYGRELLQFLFNKLPFIIFFFLPFFALSIWLLYVRQKINYMEHLVFTFHTQTMFFILLGIGILTTVITKNETPTAIALFIFLYYLYKAMRKFYSQKRGKTIVKFLLVNILFFILATIGSVFTILGSIFIF